MKQSHFLTWKGPYLVLEGTSEVNYKVAEPIPMAKWSTLHHNMLKPYFEEGNAWSPKKKKRTKALRSGGVLKNPGVNQGEWKEQESDISPTHHQAKMRRHVQRRRLNERIDDNVSNMGQLFRECDVPESDGIPAKVPPEGNRPEAPVAADEASAEPSLQKPEQLADDQPTGVPEPREATAVSPDTGPARRPRRKIHPVIRLGIEE